MIFICRLQYEVTELHCESRSEARQNARAGLSPKRQSFMDGTAPKNIPANGELGGVGGLTSLDILNACEALIFDEEGIPEAEFDADDPRLADVG